MTPVPQKPTQLPSSSGPSALARLIGPLLFAVVGPAGDTRRELVAFLGIAIVMFNQKLGLNLDHESIGIIVGGLVSLAVSGHLGTASATKSQANAQAQVMVAQAENQPQQVIVHSAAPDLAPTPPMPGRIAREVPLPSEDEGMGDAAKLSEKP